MEWWCYHGMVGSMRTGMVMVIIIIMVWNLSWNEWWRFIMVVVRMVIIIWRWRGERRWWGRKV